MRLDKRTVRELRRRFGRHTVDVLSVLGRCAGARRVQMRAAVADQDALGRALDLGQRVARRRVAQVLVVHTIADHQPLGGVVEVRKIQAVSGHIERPVGALVYLIVHDIRADTEIPGPVGVMDRVGQVGGADVLIVVLSVHHEAQSELLDVAQAATLTRFFTRLGEHREKDSRQNRDDRDHHQQFYESETSPCSPSAHRVISSTVIYYRIRLSTTKP